MDTYFKCDGRPGPPSNVSSIADISSIYTMYQGDITLPASNIDTKNVYIIKGYTDFASYPKNRTSLSSNLEEGYFTANRDIHAFRISAQYYLRPADDCNVGLYIRVVDDSGNLYHLIYPAENMSSTLCIQGNAYQAINFSSVSYPRDSDDNQIIPKGSRIYLSLFIDDVTIETLRFFPAGSRTVFQIETLDGI